MKLQSHTRVSRPRYVQLPFSQQNCNAAEICVYARIWLLTKGRRSEAGFFHAISFHFPLLIYKCTYSKALIRICTFDNTNESCTYKPLCECTQECSDLKVDSFYCIVSSSYMKG